MAQAIKFKQRAHGWLSKESQREALAGYLFILPTFIGYTVFIIGPILAAIGFSLTSYDILSPPEFKGLQNYIKIFSDRHAAAYGLSGIRFISRWWPSRSMWA